MSGKTYLRSQQFFKPNYYEAIKYILPSYLYEDDIQTTPKDSDPVDLIINSHISIANNISSVLPISGIPDTVYSSLASFNGISPFFVKQNNLTNITTKTFEDKVLYFYNKTFNDFSTSAELSSYLESTILPGIALNNPDTSVFSDVGESSAIQVYLINELSWMYMLNTSGASFDPSSYVRDVIVDKLYRGNPFRIDDGIKGLVEHVWRNDLTDYYPTSLFASSSEDHLNGTQQLEKFKTWVEVIYSPLYADRSDFKVKDRFDLFYENSTTYVDKIESGPFARLIRALSFFAFDISNETEQISTLYDIDDCPDEYLPLIAQLIGWDLFGSDPNRWRLQLRSAVPVYKAIGTKAATQRAINTIFPKSIFPIEGRLTELWESYVPYLIYYALATESEYFKDYSTWTSETASRMGVTRYSSTSMDENIKLAVDRIIYETVLSFPSKFNTEFWPEYFNYRSRNYPVPPFEEYPYYVNVELNNEMIDFITDRLVCFGVREQFALDVSSYIYNNSLATDDQPREGSWLLFTSGYNEPSNLSSLITNINDKRFEYTSLWSGKSSHFKLVLDASEFDFAKKGLDSTLSQDAVTVVSKAVRNSAPAHSIPLISLEVSGDSDVLSLSGDILPLVWMDRVEVDAGAGRNNYSTALVLGSYKRGVNESGTVIGRSATKNSVTPEILASVTATDLDRNSARRRSYEKVMPFNGYYDRTGFNMPIGFGVSGDLTPKYTLGLVPSSNTFVPVSSHLSLPDIWDQCEGLQSTNTYYEYAVSNTISARDLSGSLSHQITRGQLPEVYATMHSIKERQKWLLSYLEYGPPAILEEIAVASSYYEQDPIGTELWLDALYRVLESRTSGSIQSFANSMSNDGIDASGEYNSSYTTVESIDKFYSFPASQQSFYNFEFGRDLHRLYHIYKNNFQWHRLSPDVQEQDGANIFSHTFGPLLYNHDFEYLGDYASDIITTDLGNAIKLTYDSSSFSSPVAYVASDATDMYVDTFELVSSGLLDGVELVHTSGASDDSSFSLFRVPMASKSVAEDPYMFDKTFVLMRADTGALPRVRFDLSKYQEPATHPVQTNFLSPDHDFSITFDSVICKDAANSVGGRTIHVWVHTKPEDGNMWSYTKDGSWVQHDALLTRQQVLNTYSHSKFIPQRTKNRTAETARGNNLECLDRVASEFVSPVAWLSEEDFDNFTVNFHTRNRNLVLPRLYQKSYNQLHRLDQEYVVEIFMSPKSNSDDYMLVDKVEMQDLTLKRLTEVFAAGTLSNPLCKIKDFTKVCEEYRVDLNIPELFSILRHFNNLSGKGNQEGLASRNSSKTSAIMGTDGGSRLDYRLHLDFLDKTELTSGVTTFGNIYEEIVVDV
jgi:hypothetical protein